MRNIDSYDSRYPLEYYEIGTIYSFYCSSIAGKFKKADSEYISKYSSKLLELQKEENTNVIQSVKTQSSKLFSKSLQRFYPKKFEIIAISDGSKDGSAAVVQEISDERLIFINDIENHGFLHTLNRQRQL